MAVVHGETPHPRVVAQGFDREHPFAAVIEQYAGTVHYLTDDNNIRWESYDAVVAIGNVHRAAKHMCVLQVGGTPVGHTNASTSTKSRPFLSVVGHVGDELDIPDNLSPELKDLVRRELVPLVATCEDGRPYSKRIYPARLAENSDASYTPLLVDLDRYAYAAIYEPPLGAKNCLYLPEVVTNLAPWLLQAFKLWSVELPDIFPFEPEWTKNPQWMTQDELVGLQRVVDAQTEADWMIAQARASVSAAESVLSDLRRKADMSTRLLLTGGDDPLVDAVADALSELGFQVDNVDKALAPGQARKEDLRVKDGEWIALCEVKGYTKGAKLGDISKLQNYATLFAVETGSPPSGIWYAVNAYRDSDPTGRPALLPGADEYIEVFAEVGGLAIDTRDLFLLLKAIETGALDRQSARAGLKASVGRYQLPVS